MSTRYRMFTVALSLMCTLNSNVALASSSEPASSCNRTCLEGFARSYLDAVVAHEPGKAQLSDSIKYTENQARLEVGSGLWRTAKRLGEYRIFVSDIRRGQAVYLGNIETQDGWSMLAVRLRIADNKVSEAEVIIPGPAAEDGTFNLGGGAARLGTARAAFSADLEPTERRDRSQIIQAADLHYEGIERGSGDIVPFGENCIKIENGVQLIRNPDFPSPVRSPIGADLPNYQSMGCQDQFNTHVWDTDTITDRRYPVVDEERGIVVAFAMYNQYAKGPCAVAVDQGPVCPSQVVNPYSLAIAEAFRVRDGFIEEVESIFTVLPELRIRGVW